MRRGSPVQFTRICEAHEHQRIGCNLGVNFFQLPRSSKDTWHTGRVGPPIKCGDVAKVQYAVARPVIRTRNIGPPGGHQPMLTILNADATSPPRHIPRGFRRPQVLRERVSKIA